MIRRSLLALSYTFLLLLAGLVLFSSGNLLAQTDSVERIPLPSLQQEGRILRAHTQGLEVVDGQFWVTARREDSTPRQALLLRTFPGAADWQVWELPRPAPSFDHPGGLQSDGRRLWIPLAESRRNGRTVIQAYALAALTPGQPPVPEVEFTVADHIGALAVAPEAQRLLGASWDTAQVYRWDADGTLRQTWTGSALERLGLGTANSLPTGLAVQDWKLVGDRLYASGLLRQPGGSESSASRLSVFRHFPESAPDASFVLPVVSDAPELGREGMAVANGWIYLLPGDLGASNRLFRLAHNLLSIPAPSGLGLVRSPQEWQVVQRHNFREGTVPLRGKGPVGCVIEWRITGSPRTGQLPEGWQTLTPSADGTFDTRLTLPAGGWYSLEVRARNGTAVLAQETIEHVGVGEVFLIAGQSNSANHGEERQVSTSGRVSAFDGTHWRPADDPQRGASGDGGSFLPPFGDAMSARFGVPIGLVPTGVGATSVREWLPPGIRFAQPPTLTGNVIQLSSGEWESRGTLFTNLAVRLQDFGPSGLRAALWHQGESDANQKDPTRTLPGTLYRTHLERLIRSSQEAVGWKVPWFVAQASYHTPDDPGSPDIRAAQQALWDSGVALAGPDTDALTGSFRDQGGQGVHFSGPGLREHAARWVAQVAPWLDQQLAASAPSRSAAPPPLVLPGMETFTVAGRPAFLFLPSADRRTHPQPWIFYAPTLPAYPDEAERWMHEQFLAAGVAVAGVDVGEAYGSPASHAAFDALYQELARRGLAAKPCVFGRSRGGLWVSSWAIAHPDRVAGLIGIYPVFDFRTYPGLTNAAPAYGRSPSELAAQAADLNPIERIEVLARAGLPAALIHGDQDVVVPLKENSGEFVRRYREAGADALVKLLILEGQGHSFYEGFFRSQELVDQAIAWARAGAER